MEQKFGTTGIKNILTAGFALGQAISLALEDGFQPVPDALSTLPSVLNVAAVVKSNGQQAKDEFNEFSPEERTDVVTWFEKTFDIRDDSAEEKIEAIFGLIIAGDRTRVLFRKAG